MDKIARIEPDWHGKGPEYDDDKYSSPYDLEPYDDRSEGWDDNDEES